MNLKRQDFETEREIPEQSMFAQEIYQGQRGGGKNERGRTMLNERQVRIAGEVVRAEKPVGEIMREEGYARETYYLWMRENQEFQGLIKQLQNESRQAAINVLKAGSLKAANLLIKAIEDGRISKSRIDAANSVLAKAGIVPEYMYKNLIEPPSPQRLTIDEVKEMLREMDRKVV